MGQSQYGLHHWLSKNPERKRCHLCCYRSTLKSCSLPSNPRVYFCQLVSRLRGSLFTSRFWQSFQNAMGTHLSFSTDFHPQSSGQVKRVNQILEDMLRACVISFGKNWEKSLPFAEFAYNNSFQSSLNMAPFEFLYGRRCRKFLNWSETGERQLFGPDMIKEAEE